MKTIENKKVVIAKKDYTYAELIIDRLKQTPKEGFNDIMEMRKRIKLLDIMEKATDAPIELEDADFDLIKKVIDPSYLPWAVTEKPVVEFIDACL